VTGIKKIKFDFFKKILLASFLVFLIGIYPLSQYASGIQITSIISGYIISLVNAVLGFLMILWALSKSTHSFMVIVFGGMIARMVFIFIILILLISYSNTENVTLISSVFFFYFLFMSIEIFYLVRKDSGLNSK
jgi:hypothetical protein